MLENYGRQIGRKVKWSLQNPQEEYMQTYGSRNIQLEGLDVVAAMAFKGKPGWQFTHHWFDMVRPDGLSVHQSLLDIASGHQAIDFHGFVDWIDKQPKNVIENEKRALVPLAQHIGSTIKEKATVENGIQMVKRSKKAIKEKATAENAKKAYRLVESVAEGIIAHRRSRKDTEGVQNVELSQDDVHSFQAVIVRARPEEETLGEIDEDDRPGDVIHIGDLDLLDERLRPECEE